ncbi:phosphoglucosamine mutase [Thiolapillus brandeum]|uniref:Phosphoglucosamine mutase n=1 Tax=Thiolapillus brandeum TaxID=1076588 RepID=A0A7U6GJ91_9GAMM|nr:phosphoglucosamine mutase [Thiolapillus brandeum]BAO44627.1 phosphoglucosamine mutase [Thiolapillus brandeum]
MTKRKYFGTDGIRGRVGEGKINPEFVLKLGWAAGRVLGNGSPGKVLIGKDTRISGYMFESALEAGLVAAGMDILMLGPMPTPGIAYLTRTLHASVGIVISASHNPYYDNGIKFFSATGAKLPDEVELAIEAEIDKPLVTVDPASLGKVTRVDDAAGRYIEFCKSTVPHHLDLSSLKVVVDCANGATYHIAPHVLEELGAQVSVIGADPDGFNINSRVGSTNPEALQQAVLQEKADVGIALDGDGDRLIMVDHTGATVDGDGILYIIARSRMAHPEGLKGPVVGTTMSNLGLDLALRELGVELVRTDVGDRYILAQLDSNSWTLGGEPSGHIICRDRTTTGDGLVSALQVLAEMVMSDSNLHDLSMGMQRMPQTLINVDLGTASPANVMKNPSVLDAVAAVEKTLGDDGRVLLRPSGTEPLIRVMVEGREATLVTQLAGEIASVVESVTAA